MKIHKYNYKEIALENVFEKGTKVPLIQKGEQYGEEKTVIVLEEDIDFHFNPSLHLRKFTNEKDRLTYTVWTLKSAKQIPLNTKEKELVEANEDHLGYNITKEKAPEVEGEKDK